MFSITSLRFGQQDSLSRWENKVSGLAEKREKAALEAQERQEQIALMQDQAFLNETILTLIAGDEKVPFSSRTVLEMMQKMDASSRESNKTRAIFSVSSMSKILARRMIVKFQLNEPGVEVGYALRRNRFENFMSRTREYSAEQLQDKKVKAQQRILEKSLTRAVLHLYKRGLIKEFYNSGASQYVRLEVSSYGEKALKQPPTKGEQRPESTSAYFFRDA